MTVPDENARRAYVLDRIRRRALPELAGRTGDAPAAAWDGALSSGQERLWFLEQLDPGNCRFHEGFRIDFPGRVDPERLAAALACVVARHEALRTFFPTDGATARQAVLAVPAPDFTLVEDLAGEEPARARAEMERRILAFARRPFRLDRVPPLRAALFVLPEGRDVLAVANHHLICDAASRRLIAQDLGLAYREGRDDRGPATPYRVFSIRQRRALDAPGHGAALARWVERLTGAPALPLPLGRPRSGDDSGMRTVRIIGGDLHRRIALAAQRAGTTAYAVYLAAFAFVLGRTAGIDDVTIGCPIDGRSAAERDVVGFCTGVLPIRLRIDEALAARDFLRAVGAQLYAALADAEIPFEAIVTALNPPRDPLRSPIFQAALSLQPETPALDVGDGPAVAAALDLGVSRLDLTLELLPRADGLWCGLEHRVAVVDGDAAHALLDRFEQALEAMAGAEETSLGGIDLTTPAQRQCVLERWNAPVAPLPAQVDAVARLAAHAARAADALAVECAGARLSYAALWQRVEAWAAALTRLGVAMGDPVAVALPRDLDLPAAIFAVLKIGAVYVPVDPGLPVAHLAALRKNVGCRVAIGVSASRPVLASAGFDIILTTAEPVEGTGLPPTPPDPAARAYVIHTSGSTGAPKGVAVSRGSLAVFLAAMDGLLSDGGPQTWLAATSIAFDISLLELVWTLAAGHTLVLAPEAAPLAPVLPAATRPAAPIPSLSLFFFAADATDESTDRYGTLIEAARFADGAGFEAVWTPERHFHPFGGLYPNPSVLSAALARETRRIAIRAGSVVAPLHHPVRIAEEWSVVDNLSGGRAGVAFAAGWQAEDFVFDPDAYADRHTRVERAIDMVRALWRGDPVPCPNGAGTTTTVRLYPPPVQRALPTWLTASGAGSSFERAGTLGAGVLTHLVGQSLADVAQKIAAYRRARVAAGHPGTGAATLMLHTHLGRDGNQASDRARGPLRSYLASSADLVRSLGRALGLGVDVDRLEPHDLDAILDQAVARYLKTASLIGSIDDARRTALGVGAAGVTEIACLVDFGLPKAEVLAGLEVLAELHQSLRPSGTSGRAEPVLVDASVTHAQLTPTVARAILSSPGGAQALARLRLLLVGGEPLGADLCRQLTGLGPGVINLYGPTEATVWATAHGVTGAEAPPIGRPLGNMRAYVLDLRRRLLGPGLPGDLWLGGAAVAEGYVGRAAETAAAFLLDPFDSRPGARMYRTGDRALWTGDGELLFLGRGDDQIKLRGVRIELAAVESLVRDAPGCADCAAAVVRGADGEDRLTAYVVPLPGATIDPEEIRRHVRRAAPPAYVPSLVAAVGQIPRTVGGKVDRGALPAASPAPRSPLALPRSAVPVPAETIGRVLALWSDVLGVVADDPDANFFDAGGHSLAAARLVARCREAFGASVSLADFFADPTPRALALQFSAPRRDGETPETTRHHAPG